MNKSKQMIDALSLYRQIEETLNAGYAASFTITGMSMWPILCHNRDQVILEQCNAEDLKLGDIVLFKIPLYDKVMLHRITKLNGDLFQSTGDGNLFRDGWFPLDCIIGKADYLVRKGKRISTSSIVWRIVFHLWMVLFPVRRYLLKLLVWISRSLLSHAHMK